MTAASISLAASFCREILSLHISLRATYWYNAFDIFRPWVIFSRYLIAIIVRRLVISTACAYLCFHSWVLAYWCLQARIYAASYEGYGLSRAISRLIKRERAKLMMSLIFRHRRRMPRAADTPPAAHWLLKILRLLLLRHYFYEFTMIAFRLLYIFIITYFFDIGQAYARQNAAAHWLYNIDDDMTMIRLYMTFSWAYIYFMRQLFSGHLIYISFSATVMPKIWREKRAKTEKAAKMSH